MIRQIEAFPKNCKQGTFLAETSTCAKNGFGALIVVQTREKGKVQKNVRTRMLLFANLKVSFPFPRWLMTSMPWPSENSWRHFSETRTTTFE